MAQQAKLVPFTQGKVTSVGSSLGPLDGAYVPDGDTRMCARIANRVGTEATAIIGTSNLGALAQRGTALLHGHAFSLQERAIGHAWDAVYAETDGRKQSYLAGVADQTIHQLNHDLQQVTDNGVQRIRRILQRDGVPPDDTRSQIAKAIKPYPDE